MTCGTGRRNDPCREEQVIMRGQSVLARKRVATLAALALLPANEDIYYRCPQNANCGGVQDNSNGTQTTLRFGRKTGSTRFTTDAPLVIGPSNPSVLYVGGNVPARAGDDGSHLYETTDGGATWTSVSGILPNAPIEDLIFGHSGSALHVSTDRGPQQLRGIARLAGPPDEQATSSQA
jgi:hypothetical protein